MSREIKSKLSDTLKIHTMNLGILEVENIENKRQEKHKSEGSVSEINSI